MGQRCLGGGWAEREYHQTFPAPFQEFERTKSVSEFGFIFYLNDRGCCVEILFFTAHILGASLRAQNRAFKRKNRGLAKLGARWHTSSTSPGLSRPGTSTSPNRAAAYTDGVPRMQLWGDLRNPYDFLSCSISGFTRARDQGRSYPFMTYCENHLHSSHFLSQPPKSGTLRQGNKATTHSFFLCYQ